MFKHPNPLTFNSSHRQYFCLPKDLILHLNTNPCSAKGFEKLQKTCKYFFAKNQIFICNKMVCQENKEFFYFYEKNKYYLPKTKLRYWLTGNLEINSNDLLDFSNIFYRCSLKRLNITFWEVQDFPLNEINFLLKEGKLESLSLTGVDIFDQNAILVSCDKILSKCPNILQFTYSCKNEIFTNELLENMNALKFNSKFNRFFISIYKLGENLDFTLLCNFIKNNSAINSTFCFQFLCDGPEHYCKILENIAKIEMNKDDDGDIIQNNKNVYVNYEQDLDFVEIETFS